MTSRVTELRWALGVFVLLAATFIALPQIDLFVSGLFFQKGQWLVPRDTPWLQIPYRGLPRLGQATVLTLMVLFVLSCFPALPRLRAKRVTFGFLLTAALVGPVLLVDVGLKDHSGRARPINVQAFGGSKTFSPAFIPADQCTKNCAFVSGHVATASFLMAFGWLCAPAVRRRWLVAGMVSGGFMALARMMPGGHFLSDALFAWFSVYFSLWGVHWLFLRLGWLQPNAPSCAMASSDVA